MSQAAPDPLLVSSVNGGGVFLVEGRRVDRLSRVDTTGIAAVPGGFLLARQAEGIAELRRLSGRDVTRVSITDQSLDLHDLLWHDDRLYVVGTERNTVYEFEPDFTMLRHWPLAEAPDSQHVNSVCMHEGRLLGSRFGAFERHRGYKGRTRGAGEIFDVVTGEVLVRGLSQPHSLKSNDGLLWVCDSETHTVRAYRDFAPVREHRFDGYVRGLAFGATAAYVGLSRSRNDPDPRLSSACVLALDRETMAERGRITLMVDEVYDLCLVAPSAVDDLRAAAFADAIAEFDTCIRERDRAREEALQASERASLLAAQLHSEQAARTAEAGAARVAAEDLAAEAEAEAEWVRMLAAENARLRDGLLAARADLVVQERALQGLQSFADAVSESRWWRMPGLRPGGLRPPARPEPRQPSADPGPGADRADVPVPGLEFAVHRAPRVSIVVPANGAFDETLRCLRAIRRAGDEATFEVIVIDDTAGDREMARLRSVPGLRYHANDRSLGWVASVNRAMALARGEYLQVVDSAARVRDGWLDALLRTFALFDDCGLAGPRLVDATGRLLASGGIVSSDGEARAQGRGDAAGDPAHATVREVDYVPAAAFAIPTALLRALGGLGEAFPPSPGADVDLAFRVREHGCKVYFQAGATVVHEGGPATDGATEPAAQARSRDALAARWGDALAREQLAPGEHPFLARERGQLKSMVLVVDHELPHPDRDAGSRAIWQLMRVLFLRGFTVKFRAERAEGDAGGLELLRMHGIEPVGGDDAEFQDWLARNGRYVDHVVLSRPLVAARHIDLVRLHTPASVIYYGHDVHYLRLERQFAVTRGDGLDAQAQQLRRVERNLWRAADLVLYPSSEETAHVREWLEATGDPGRVDTVPLFAYEGVAQVERDADSLAARRDVLFVGGFAHAPNEDGVLWFASEVWPLVRTRAGGARLCIVGASPTASVSALAADDVVVAGHVSEDALVAHYAASRVAVAPLRFGAGTKGKVLEAMRQGVPCVTTPVGAQGLASATGLRVAGDARSMADDIVALFEDDAAWRAASEDGQAFIVEGFTTASVWRVLTGILGAGGYASVQARRARLEATGDAYRPPALPTTTV